MSDLKKLLKSNLNGAKKIAVLGVGSELRGDDMAGILAAQALEKTAHVKVFLGYTAPENLSGEIRKYAPTHLIIIDSAEMGKKPGEISVFKPENAVGISFSTHKLPLKIMAEYLHKTIGCDIIIIGIQPKQVEFGEKISKKIERSAKMVAGIVKEVLKAI